MPQSSLFSEKYALAKSCSCFFEGLYYTSSSFGIYFVLQSTVVKLVTPLSLFLGNDLDLNYFAPKFVLVQFVLCKALLEYGFASVLDY